MNRLRISLLSLASLVLVSGAYAQQSPYIVAANGERVNVERILARPNGDLVVTINGAPQNVARNQYLQAVGVKPEGFDAAVSQVQSGEYEAGAAALEEILRKSAYQSWDALAGKALIEGAIREDKSADASRVFSQLTERYGDQLTEIFPEMQVVQWKLRIAEGDTGGLEEELTGIIQEEQSRLKRGMAQVARGDLKFQRRDFPAAVLDYLRAVYFYPDVADLQAEALYKTAVTFSEIGDTGRLRQYEQQLKQTYPDSPFAAMTVGN